MQKILALYATKKYRQKDLAEMFGIHQTMVGFIVRGELWTHVSSDTNTIQ